jgi:peptidoglycan LD-endopeptidase CwlK
MPNFSVTSTQRLATCHPALEKLMFHVIRDIDISIIEGWRSPERQLQLYDEGKSKLTSGKHNHTIINEDGKKIPWSLAVDIAPYPIDFGKTPKQVLKNYVDVRMCAADLALLEREIIKTSRAISRFYFLAGLIKERADQLNIKVRWGGDWDNDNDFFDQTFYDLVHWELVGYEDKPHDNGELQYVKR